MRGLTLGQRGPLITKLHHTQNTLLKNLAFIFLNPQFLPFTSVCRTVFPIPLIPSAFSFLIPECLFYFLYIKFPLPNWTFAFPIAECLLLVKLPLPQLSILCLPEKHASSPIFLYYQPDVYCILTSPFIGYIWCYIYKAYLSRDVHSFTQWMRPGNPPSPRIWIRIYGGAIGQSIQHLFVILCLLCFLHSHTSSVVCNNVPLLQS
jgi:hypothetical protein